MAGGSLGGGAGRGSRLITEINVTPFVDIVLVLLIIFMVTATYIVRDSIDVKLPEASTGEPVKVSILAITVDQAGALQLNGDKSDDGAIRRFIRAERRAGRKLEAVIAADKRVPYGKVVHVIDLVRAEGVVKFAINVIKPGG